MSQCLLTYLKSRITEQEPAPLYHQLQDAIQAAIEKKLLVHGNVLPSERKLSEALGISRVTVVKALAVLKESGLLIKKQGWGTLVNQPVQYNLSNSGFSSQLQNKGIVSNRWLVRELVTTDEQLSEKLELNETLATLARIKRVRLIDDVPVSIETMHIPEQYLPRPDLLEGSLYSYWKARGIEPEQQEYLLSIHMPSPVEAAMLETPDNLPLMKMVLTSRERNGKVLEHGFAICRSDYYSFKFNINTSRAQ
ncbi:MAG: GntR family transcriptional regulator [Endozoicomonas sp.]